MFNQITYKNESKVVAVTKEIEKTISPDKVTEMYDAVREQVEKDILGAYVIESNQLNGVVVVMENHFSNLTSRFVAKYILNGKEYITKGYIPRDGVIGREALFEEVYKHYKEEVARELLKESIQLVAQKKF